MNKLWTLLIIITFVIMMFISPENIINSMVIASEKAVTLCITLLGIYALWLGILELVERTGLNKKLAKLVKPISIKLFGKQDKYTNEQIAINISSNMLGMGNASTPSGIKAMQALDKGNGKITKAMIMLMIINTTAIQLVPTTVIGLRVSAGSNAPTSIVLPTLIATSISTLTGILLVVSFDKLIKIFRKRKEK